VDDSEELQTSFLSSDRGPQRNKFGVTASSAKYIDVLSGSKTVVGQVLSGILDESPRIFFIFPDLCCRATGIFKIQCAVIQMPSSSDEDSVRPKNVTVVRSAPFTNYSLRLFPGSDGPTLIEDRLLSRGNIF
jgi:hypothetical protein